MNKLKNVRQHLTGPWISKLLPSWLKKKEAVTDGITLPVIETLSSPTAVHEKPKTEQVKNFYPSVGKDPVSGRPTHITLKRAFPKVHRNTACPCGSGLKYKKCCEIKHRL